MKATWAGSPVLEGRTLEMDWWDGDSGVLSLSPPSATAQHCHHPHPHHYLPRKVNMVTTRLYFREPGESGPGWALL